jgi:hypothetical protein
MNKLKVLLIIFILFALFFWIKIFLFLTEDNLNNKLNSFTTDWCSMFFDGDWIDCCIEHDKYYWIWWTKDKRKTADEKLKDCVIDKGHYIIWNMMYLWVRIWGIPYLPTSFRWWYWWDKFVWYNKINYEK